MDVPNNFLIFNTQIINYKTPKPESLIRRINSLTMNVPNNVVVSLQMPAILLHLLQKQLKIWILLWFNPQLISTVSCKLGKTDITPLDKFQHFIFE